MAPPTPSSSTMGINFSIFLELSNLLGLLGKEMASLFWILQSISASWTLKKDGKAYDLRYFRTTMINQITLTSNY